ncbi:MAG: hypothetical protein GXZ11_00630 [Tissierellia bacterium]|nr:hypothetical protein [Tissierellia bacterium]
MINKALKNVITLLLVVVLLISNMTSVCAVSDREVNSSKPKLSLPLNHEFSKDEVTILTKNGELTLDLNELRTTGKAVVLLERFLTLDETAYNFPVMVTSFSGAETVELNWLDNGETVEEEFNTEYESVVTLIKLWKSYYDESSADFIKEQLKIIANSRKSKLNRQYLIQKD